MLDPCHKSSGETTVKFSGILGGSSCHIEIGHNGSIYTIEINKCYKPGLPAFPPENQLSDSYQESTG